MFFMMNLTSVLIIWFGSLRIDAGEMHVGAMMASLQYAIQILFAVFMVTAVFVMLPRAAASAERINEVLDVVPDVNDPPQPTAAGATRGHVEFQDVTFQYPGAEEPALTGVSFTALPGEVTAVIGGTGSGKSTLAGLIPRFYDVAAGRVLVDGVDVREMRQEDLRDGIGFVPQKAVLFSGTIASNIRFGRDEATDEDMRHAATVAQAAEFIDRMPEGYASPVSQGGINLSGGQKQRLAIARALVAPRRNLRVRRQLLGARLRHRRQAARRAEGRHRRRHGVHRLAAHRHRDERRPDRRAGRWPGRRHRQARGTAADLRRLPRDRRIAGVARGGGVSGERTSTRPSAPAAGMFGGRPMSGLGMPVQKARDFKGTLRRLTGYLEPHRPALIVVMAAGVIATLFSVIGPKMLGLATTRIFEGYLARTLGRSNAGIDFAYVGRILSTLLVLYVVSAAFQYLQQYLMSGVAQKTVYALRRAVEAKFSRLPLRFFDSKTHGEIMSRAVNDLDNISSTLQQNLTQLVTSVLTVVGIVIMMLTISWLLTIVVVLTLPLSVVVVSRLARRSQGYFVRQQKALGDLNGHVAEMYAGHTIVTAFGHEARAVATFDELNGKYYDGAWRAQFVTGMMFPIMMFIGNLGYVAVAVIGGFLVTRRAIALGDVQAFIQYHRQFSMPISQLSSIANSIQLTIASAERVFELLDEPEEPADTPAAATLPAARGDVQFDHVAFSYKADAPLIEDLSIQVTSGQMVAIVGPTGAGKTTLVNLLMRFYDVNAGSIRVDGVDIRELTEAVCGGCSAWCCRTPGCSRAAFATTSPTAAKARAKRRSSTRPGRRRPITSSARCPTTTTR